MVITPELTKFINQEIRKQINIILYSLSGENDEVSEELDQVFPGMPKSDKRPVAHPWGYCSRAPSNTPQVNARVGEHVSNRIVLGHRDSARINLGLKRGENAIYNDFGQQVTLKDGLINLGKNANEPVVLGNVLVTLLSSILDILIAGAHVLTTTPGNPTIPNPGVATQLTQLKTQYLTTPATDILSQEAFVERLKP